MLSLVIAIKQYIFFLLCFSMIWVDGCNSNALIIFGRAREKQNNPTHNKLIFAVTSLKQKYLLKKKSFKQYMILA